MSCLEIRRRILADPPAARRTATAHLSACAPCCEFAASIERLDAQVAAAVALPAPAHLVDRIVGATLQPMRQRRRFMAAAACLVAASTAAGLLSFEADDPIALAGIDFVVDEEAHAILAAGPVDSASLARAVRTLRIELPPQLGALRYIGTCPFEGSVAHHVIATTPHGKVTLLLLPDRRVAVAGSARSRGLRALVRPAGEGGIAVIAESRRSLERASAMVLRA
jgi:hypothetical protein